MTSAPTERLKLVINEMSGVPTDRVTAEASFDDHLGLDSLEVLSLLGAVEIEFHVEISDRAASKLKTVGDLSQLLESLK